jgi:hypothetical protein
MSYELSSLEFRILEAGDEDVEALTRDIAGRPDPAMTLERLARSSEPAVRSWIPELAAAVMGQDAMPLLMRLFTDDDPDVRGLAFDEIERLDPTAPERLLPQLRLHLRSLDDAEVVRAGWVMVRLRDTTAIPAIDAYVAAASEQPTHVPFKAMSVVRMALAEPHTVAEAIRAHDHDRMMWLAHAATLIRSNDCMDALAWGISGCPDATCRELCQRASAAASPRDATTT